MDAQATARSKDPAIAIWNALVLFVFAPQDE